MELGVIPLARLAGVCREETGKFQRHEPSRDEFCLELFRRAIAGRAQAAWDAIIAQYRGMVLAWIRQHPAAPAVRDDDDYWVNRAFERFWGAVGPERLASFPTLAALLRYLKLCVHSTLLDEVRARGATRLEPLAVGKGEPAVALDLESTAISQQVGRELWSSIEAELGDETERLVARLCLVLELKPSEVHARYPDHFASVADVYRIKRNLLDRLRRSPEIRRFLD